MPCGTIEKKDIDRIFVGFALEAQKQLLHNSPHHKKRIIVLAGPTACGKSSFALELAKQIDGEIVSADSMQVYRGMDIGTAKPTKDELSQIPHHMIDIRNVDDQLNVVDFFYEARLCCQKILERGKVPIIVGGAGFYIHSLLYGPPAGPPSIPEVRKSLEEEYEKVGAQALYERLVKLDPKYAAGITKNDKQKIIRALEIITLTGKKVSELTWKNRKKQQNYDFRCWFLFRPRESLYRRIEARCDQMVESGFIDEVKKVIEMGIKNNSSAAQAIGYRQAIDYLETEQNKEDFKRFMVLFKQVSRNYAKRQHTWFAKEPMFNWVDMDLHDQEVIMDLIIKDYEMGL